jgi:NADH-quinone oxidoreductase subunit N
MESAEIVAPQAAVLAGAAAVIVYESINPRGRKVLPWLALAGLAVAFIWTLSLIERDKFETAFEGTYAFDQYAAFFYVMFISITAAVVVASIDWLDYKGRGQAEYLALMLVSASGLMFLSGARDLITIFVALETSSIPQYILAGWGKDERSSEAGLKYLLTGSVAAAVLLYGMVLLYGVTGTTSLDGIGDFVATQGGDYRAVLIFSATLLIVGFGFKMAIVPSQLWVPDVYQAAPTPVVAYLSVASKAAGFAIIIRVFFEALSPDVLSDDWSMAFAIIAAVTMTFGNIAALVQTDIKRMLGYSSIAQAGNFAIGLAAISAAGEEFTLGATAILVFAATYAFTNLGAFFAIIAIGQKIESDEIADYAGMWHRAPWLALGLAFCLVSLTGLPPTAGFWAKMFIFNAAVQSDLVWLVIIGVLNSLISAFYYLGVVRQMFVGEAADGAEPIQPAPGIWVALAVAAIGVLVLGIFPQPIFDAASDATVIFGVLP